MIKQVPRSKERRTYQLKGVAATILAGGDIKKGDKMSVNFMNKKTDDFENFETQVWKPVAEKNILAGNLRQWILVEAIGYSSLDQKMLILVGHI